MDLPIGLHRPLKARRCCLAFKRPSPRQSAKPSAATNWPAIPWRSGATAAWFGSSPPKSRSTDAARRNAGAAASLRAFEIVSAQHGAGKLDWLDDPVSPARRPMAGEDVTGRNILSVGTGRPSLLSVQPMENIDDELEPFPPIAPARLGVGDAEETGPGRGVGAAFAAVRERKMVSIPAV